MRPPVDRLGLGAPPSPKGRAQARQPSPPPSPRVAPSPPELAGTPAAGREGPQEGLGLQPSLAPSSSLPCPPGPVMQAVSRRLAAPLGTLGRPLQGRREAWAWLPPGPPPHGGREHMWGRPPGLPPRGGIR